MSKSIHVKYLLTGKTIPLEVQNDETIESVKKRCAELLGLSQIEGFLLVKHQKRRSPKSLENESLTVEQAHIKTDDEIIIGKTLVRGGNKKNNK